MSRVISVIRMQPSMFADALRQGWYVPALFALLAATGGAAVDWARAAALLAALAAVWFAAAACILALLAVSGAAAGAGFAHLLAASR
jgi:hypothetical protein